jgi:hypothetical protein
MRHRPIGHRIRQVCEAIEQAGRPCTTADLAPHMPGVERPNIDKYCSRAVGLQLLRVDRSARPKRYTVVPGWQLDPEATRTTQSKPPPKPISLYSAWR